MQLEKCRQNFLAADKVIELATLALRECDTNGFVYAAIDLASAIEKLDRLKMGSQHA